MAENLFNLTTSPLNGTPLLDPLITTMVDLPSIPTSINIPTSILEDIRKRYFNRKWYSKIPDNLSNNILNLLPNAPMFVSLFLDNDTEQAEGFKTFINTSNLFLDILPDSMYKLLLKTGIGAVNIIDKSFGRTTDTLFEDKELLSKVGGSYGGGIKTINTARDVSNKKVGFLSGGLGSKNRKIREGNNTIAALLEMYNNLIFDENTWTSQMRDDLYLSILNGRNVGQILISRHGGDIKDPYLEFLKTLPKGLDSEDYRMELLWKYSGKPKDFIEGIKLGIFTYDWKDLRWHSPSVAEDPKTGRVEFLKRWDHPTVQYELDWYNSEDGKWFRDEYELVKEKPFYYYLKRKKKHKLGGSIVMEVSTLKMQRGGKVNVIPEGALHARLHHMEDSDGLTKKGIPVVSEGQNGELELLAEIERGEIIFRIEVTKKLEELCDLYNSENIGKVDKDNIALEAGKLVTEEVIFNTLDNTNNII